MVKRKTKESIFEEKFDEAMKEWEINFNEEMNDNILSVYLENIIQNAIYKGEIKSSESDISEIVDIMI